MKEKFLILLTELGDRYGTSIIIGAIGAIIASFRKKMSLGQFVGCIVISICVSVSMRTVLLHYTSVTEESIINVICGISGIFSRNILDEIEEIIKLLSDYVKSKLDIKKDCE